MKTKIIINFKNVVSELESKDLKLCFLRNRGLFIEDSNNNLYQMELNRSGSYLDKLIKEGTVVEFNLVDASYISEWEKELWDVSEVKNFMDRQFINIA
jgi:hypothetical protein